MKAETLYCSILFISQYSLGPAYMKENCINTKSDTINLDISQRSGKNNFGRYIVVLLVHISLPVGLVRIVLQ